MRRLTPVLQVIMIVLSICVGIGGVASAEDYNVNAVVPYATPSQVATISSPATGAIFQNAQQTVSGSCQQLAPNAVVSIWRDGQVLGSTSCNSGAYSLPVILARGQNNLVARTANGNGVYGPDSTTVSVTLTQPTVVQPLPPSVNQPPTPTQQTGATNAGGQANLTLTTQDPFSLLSSNNLTTTIRVIVGGGEKPYVLQLNWGDGSTESHAIDQAGTYEFTHSYRTQRGYTVFVRVRDVKGAYTEYVYAVVSNKLDASAGKTAASKLPGKSVQKDSSWVHWYYIGLLIFIVFLAVITYWLGYHRAKKRFEDEVEKARTDANSKAGKSRS